MSIDRIIKRRSPPEEQSSIGDPAMPIPVSQIVTELLYTIEKERKVISKLKEELEYERG